ncbi:hypothetical protein Tco_0230911 [Tanacetum coccineum]
MIILMPNVDLLTICAWSSISINIILRLIFSEEFVGELDFIDPILSGIDEDNFDEDDSDEEEGEIDNDILQIEDEILEVDTFLVSEDSIPPGIESDFDSEGDIVFLDNLLNEDPILEFERFTFDIEPDVPVINNFDELNEDELADRRTMNLEIMYDGHVWRRSGILLTYGSNCFDSFRREMWWKHQDLRDYNVTTSDSCGK